MIVFFIAIFLIVITKVLVHYWSKIITKSMNYKVYLDKKKVFVDDNVRLFTEVLNRKIVPIPWIRLEMEIPVEFKFNNSKVQICNNLKNKFMIMTSLLFFEKLKRYDSFKCTKRGVYKIRTAEINIGDFFGLTTSRFEIKVSNELIVYPKIKHLDEVIEVPKSLQGEISVRRWIVSDPTQIIGIRKYNNGDGFNTIHWKASAKNGELYVKKFDFTSDPSMMIFLDIQTAEMSWEGVDYDLIEKGIDIIASLMDKALKEKISVGYAANAIGVDEEKDLVTYPNNGSSQKNKILEGLAKTTYRRTYNITKFLNVKIHNLGKNCTIVLLLSYASKELIDSLNYYDKNGYNIKIILLNNCCNVSGIRKNIEIIYSTEKEEMISNVQ